MQHKSLFILLSIFYIPVYGSQMSPAYVDETCKKAEALIERFLLYQLPLSNLTPLHCYIETEIVSRQDLIKDALNIFLNPQNSWLKNIDFKDLSKTRSLTLPNLLINELVQPSVKEIDICFNIGSLPVILHNTEEARSCLCQFYKEIAPILCAMINKNYDFSPLFKMYFPLTFRFIIEDQFSFVQKTDYNDIDTILLNEYMKRYLVY